MIAVNSDAKLSRGMPNDRQLQLRAKLGVGWSTFSKDVGLSEEEQNKIKFVIQKAEQLEQAEQERIGALVERYEHIRRQARGNGMKQCVLCSDDAWSMVSGSRICCDCKKAVCSKCSVEITAKKLQLPLQQQQQQQQVYLCKMCSEYRELWKKSGAWFFKSMPAYKIPERSMSLLSIHLLGSSRDTLARYGCGTAVAPATVSSPYLLRKVASSTLSFAADATGLSLPVAAVGNGPLYKKAAGLPSACQPWSRARVDYSDESADSNDSSEESPAHVKYRSYQLGDTASVEHLPLSPSAGSLSLLPAAPLLTDACSPVSPLDTAQQRQQRRNSISSAGSTATTTAGSGQLSATESCRDEPLSNCLHGTEADDISELATMRSPSAHHREGSRRRGVFGSSWSVQSEHSSGDSTCTMAVQPVRSETTAAMDSSSATAAISAAEAPLGTVTLTVLYDLPGSKLEIHVFEGKHLPASAAFVQLNLLPSHGKSRKLRTRTRHKTVDPYWNDVLVYHGIDVSELRTKTLRLTVKDDDTAATPNHKRVIGECRLPLLELPASQLQRYCVPLMAPHRYTQGKTSSDKALGKVAVALLYSTSRGALFVTIVRCAALVGMDQNGYSDPYVKLYLKPDKGKKSKHKTAVKKKTLNPEFNEEFVYQVSKDKLAAKTLQVTVWDYDKVGTNDFIGAVMLGCRPQATSDEAAKHWQAMLDAPNVKHEAWHKLHNIAKGPSDEE